MSHVRQLGDRCDLKAAYYDPRFFDYPASLLIDEGFPMVEFPQVLDRMTPAVAATFDAIKSAQMSHDGDALFGAHVLAAVARANERGFTFSKGKSRDRIDAAVALCMATAASDVPIEEPPQWIPLVAWA